MTERSKKLIRQYKRYLGSESSETDIRQAAECLKAGNADGITPEQVSVLFKFPEFVDAIEKSYAEYEDRLKIATRNIELSSKELTAAYEKVEDLNININAMLESLGQGLLFFDSEGVCAPVFSKSCIDLLESDPSRCYLPDILGFSEKDRENFSSWRAIVFSGMSALDFDDLKGLLPSVFINSKKQHISIDYKPMYIHEGALRGILLIATDITYRLETERQLLEIRNEAFRIKQVAQNRNGFHRLICDMYSFADHAKSLAAAPISDADRQVVLRQIHTFKGYAGSYSLVDMVEYLHRLEDELQNCNAQEFSDTLQKDSENILQILERYKELGRSLFGTDFMTQGRIVNIKTHKIDDFIRYIDTAIADEVTREKVKKAVAVEFLSMPLFQAFQSFERELSRVAELAGKPIPTYTTEGEDIPVVYSDYEEFFNALIHLARNILDHGREEPKERASAGKPETGQVTVAAERLGGDRIRITISDDGKGINAGKIRHKMEERGMDTSAVSDEDILQYIFLPDLSLKTEVTNLSGRGIGMNVIQSVVEDAGGTVRAVSGHGRPGTSFVFEFPYKL